MAKALAKTSFCWFPPEKVLAGRSGSWGRIPMDWNQRTGLTPLP